MKEIDKLYIDQLAAIHRLERDQYRLLLEDMEPELIDYAAGRARAISQSIYGKKVFVRAIIEYTNICRNNCYYCGIRKDNRQVKRYRIEKEDLLKACQEGYALGYRTFVIQGGEDSYFSDALLCDWIAAIRQIYPDCAITLSLGERDKESYQKLYKAGADRYLLRHETANPKHYRKLHPPELSFDHRWQCIQDLRAVGFAVGIGMMVGSPFQTLDDLADDLRLIQDFKPDMCGLGPFIPHRATPFKKYPAGSLDMTCFLLSLVRMIYPPVLLPATTALGTIDPKGREKGILAGANVIMPNISPMRFRKQYTLYDNKIGTTTESAQAMAEIRDRMEAIGYQIVSDRGDPKKEAKSWD